MNSFYSVDAQPLKNIAVLSHGTGGIDGRLPTAPQRLAIQRAIEFVTLDQNAKAGDPNAGHGSATSDNAELLIWPVDTMAGRVTLTRGSIISVTSGGHRINHSLSIPSPLEVHIPMFGVNIDEDVLAAMYHLFTRRLADSDDALRKRILVSVGWLAQAWRNTPNIRPADRVVMLKTGFEALCGHSGNWECAKRLRRTFETHLAGTTTRDTREILWSPSERERLTREHNGVTYQVTELQHWFLAFGKARNSVIHDGIAPNLKYRAPRSGYNGHIVSTAERLLRESIKVSMSQLDYPKIWRSMLWRSIDRQHAKMFRSRHGV